MPFIRYWNHNGHGYGLDVSNMTWGQARDSAVNAGGYLAEINDASENEFIKTILVDPLSGLAEDFSFNYPDRSLSFLYSNTVAPDGGGAAYVWIGGTDAGNEGNWTWDNSKTPISTSRAEWGSGILGSEPDNNNGTQHHLGFGLEDWPAGRYGDPGFGEFGQWNDINESNLLHSIVEFDFLVDESSGPDQDSISTASVNTTTPVNIGFVEGKIYRLRNSLTGRFLFSSNKFEIDTITGNGWINEGISYSEPSEGDKALHRFLDERQNSFFYTSNEAEKNLIINDPSFSHYRYEGIAFNVFDSLTAPSGSIPVVRYFDLSTNSHLYSTSELEQSILDQSSVYINEGVAWHGA